ncbi:MAG: thermonuclease family protein [Polaromonas sp.]|nr:thermonuclease family protein [Polaromonas sp.]
MIKNFYFHPCFRPLAQWMRVQAARKSIALIWLTLMAPQAAAATLLVQSGVVTRVVDGDTLWVQTSTSQQPLKVRLQGIDAPEICQPGGVQARDALSRQVLGKSVTVASRAHDDYGRTVGILRLAGQDMGRWMVAQGHAWVYSYRHKKGPYADELAQARMAQLGIFSDVAFEEPRGFRQRHGGCYENRSRPTKNTSKF